MLKKLQTVVCALLVLILCFGMAACNNDKPEPEPGKTEYTVTFNANGGTLTGDATLKVESGKTITQAPAATKNDFDFEAWYTLAEGGDKIDLSTYKVEKDVTLYAHYTPKSTKPEKVEYTVTFNANGGTLSGEATLKVESGKAITGAPTAAKSECDFEGWYTLAEGGEKIDLSTYKVEKDVTLYAHYTPKSVTPGDDFDPDTVDLAGYSVDPATANSKTKVLVTAKNEKVGYRLEAENATITGTPSGENQNGTGYIESPDTASGGKSIGYLGTVGNTVKFSFEADEAGVAKLVLRATSNNMKMEFEPEFFMWVDNQQVSEKDFTVALNGEPVHFESATLRGAGKDHPMTWNMYWDPVSFGKLNVKKGLNELVLTVAATTVPNMDCLDIITSRTVSAVADASANPYTKDVDVKLIVGGYEGGPAIEKAILHFAENIPATALSGSAPFSVSLGGKLGGSGDELYLCDESGAKLANTATSSAYVAIEYAVSYAGWSYAGNLSPFTYSQATSKNSWKDLSTATLIVNNLKIGDKTYTEFGGSVTATKEVPCLKDWKLDGTYSDTIQWGTPAAERKIDLKYGAYEPAALKNDGGKNALIVWLHGGGEGGTDPSIAILGNQVTGLSNDTVQKYFKTGSLNGAYVLAPQTPTQWMDIGDGVQASAPENSVYTESLFKLIKKYAEEVNKDVDLNRIYVGGCSNGGWMTLELLADHGEYFAAAYPVSSCYASAYITDGMINKLKNIPIWFTHSKNDGTLPIAQSGGSWPNITYDNLLNQNTNEIYLKLLAAGATNVYFSLFENVTVGQTSYDGHWSWIYTFRDECKFVQKHTADTKLADLKTDSKETVTLTEGGEAVTLWAWIAAQAKAAQ